jgi:hypothetical protein
MPDRRDARRIRHEMFEMVMARVSAIACGHEDAIDLNRLRHDPLMKVAVGRCPTTGSPLASQSTISRLENAPSRTEAARLAAALVDQAGTTVKPRKQEILDIDDTFCAAHGGQQLAFWNAHHDERGFASMHIYHVASGTPVVTILRPARTPKQANAVPTDATGKTHPVQRELFKQCVLATQYGQGEEGLAQRIGQPRTVARESGLIAVEERPSKTLDPAEFAQTLAKSGNPFASGRTRALAQETDGRQLPRLLRARPERPRRSRSAAKQSDEIAPFH